jgi:hypothetical protein
MFERRRDVVFRFDFELRLDVLVSRQMRPHRVKKMTNAATGFFFFKKKRKKTQEPITKRTHLMTIRG